MTWTRVKSFWGKPFDFCHVNFLLGQSSGKNREAAYFSCPPAGALLAKLFTRICLMWQDFCYYSDLISHIETTSYRTNWDQKTDTHKYILTPPVTCTQQLPVLHWIDKLLMQKFTLDRSATFWKLHVEVIICWLDSTRLSPSCKTQRKRIEMV